MDEITASDLHLGMPKDAPPAASSHNAVEPSLENESGGTGAASASHGFCFRLSLFIFCAIISPIMLLVLLIYCLYWLLYKLMSIKEVSSPGQVAAIFLKRVPDLVSKRGKVPTSQSRGCGSAVSKRVAAAKWRLWILLLLLLFLVIVVSVPGLKRIKVLGLPLWKWTVMAAVVTVGYHAISLRSQRTVNILYGLLKEDKYDFVYYAGGLRRSVNNFIFCVFILLAWELYFRSSRHGLRRFGVSEKALDIGTWTAVSLLVGAFLELAKNAVILLWESHTIYCRFTVKIRKVGLQLYFLGLVHGVNVGIFSPDKKISAKPGNVKNLVTDEENSETDVSIRKVGLHLSTYRKKQMAQYFILVARLFSRNYDTIPKYIRKRWRKCKEDSSEFVTKESVTKNVENTVNNAKIENAEIDRLFAELRVADNHKNKNSISADNDKIPYSTFEEWMTKAFNNCL